MKTTRKINTYIISEQSADNPEHVQQIILEQIKQDRDVREIIRPDIKVWKDVLFILFSLFIITAFLFLVHNFLYEQKTIVIVIVCMILGILWCVLFLKKLLITLILIYQKYAPAKIRASCLFEPCCSEYMKKAIIKYGVISGTFKGIKRIYRCRYPNGGIDEP